MTLRATSEFSGRPAWLPISFGEQAALRRRLGKAKEQAKRCSALVGNVFMDRAIWSECVEHEGKGDVIGDVDKLISLSSLYDRVADVAARGDRCLIESRRLSWLPLEQEISALDGAAAPQQLSLIHI